MTSEDFGAVPKKRFKQGLITDSFHFKPVSKECHDTANLELNGQLKEKYMANCNEDVSEDDIIATKRPLQVYFINDVATESTSTKKWDNQIKGESVASCSEQFFAGETEPMEVIDSNDSSASTSSTLNYSIESVPDSCGSADLECEPAEMPLGVPLSELKQTPCCAHNLSPLSPSSVHTVLIKTDSKFDAPPKPSSDSYADKWDPDFVRMPCSPQSLYPVGNKSDGTNKLISRWDLIKKLLSKKINSSYDLKEAIVGYNDRYKHRWNFDGLHHLLYEVLKPEESKEFFDILLPRIINLALKLPYLCTEPIPLLKCHFNHTITLSQLQIASLLANAFLCTFPRRNTTAKSEYSSYPKINFSGLFSKGGTRSDPSRKQEKLKCLFHYFRKVTSKEPCGTVSFRRQSIDKNSLPNWKASKLQLCKLRVMSSGTIDDDGIGMLQMDFANKFVGGGVLGWGCVQEEIRFITCPELIVSMLFTERLDDREAMIVTGCERYCASTGYADSFKFAGDFNDQTPRDSWGRRYTEVVAVDAQPFNYKRLEQYKSNWLEREACKAYAGFYAPETPSESRNAIATGNWGCGVFKGDPRLKFLLQIIAATEAGRDVLYFSFKDVDLCKDIYKMYTFLTINEKSVGDLWALLLEYHSSFQDGKPCQPVNQYIYNSLCQ